jgi:predicted nucleotidyltransferase
MPPTDTLARILGDQPQLQFAVLVGSRATGAAHAHSDWDIALQWSPQLDWMTVLSKTETLRNTLAEALRIAPLVYRPDRTAPGQPGHARQRG